MDVRIVLRVEPFQFRMQRFVAGARKTGIAVVDANIRAALKASPATGFRKGDPAGLQNRCKEPRRD